MENEIIKRLEKRYWSVIEDLKLADAVINRDGILFEISRDFILSELKELTEAIKRSNQLLRSLYLVTARKGRDTHWEALQKKIDEELDSQFNLMHKTNLNN